MPDFTPALAAMRRNGFDPASLPGWRMLCALVIGQPAPKPAPLALEPLPYPMPTATLRRLASIPGRRLTR